MTYTEINQIINNLQQQVTELEDMISEPAGQFCKSSITKMFKNNTSSARVNGSNVLFHTVKEVEVKSKGLMQMEEMFLTESRISDLKRRFAYCGQHLIAMITMMEEWD